jgi:hypothetical protein
MQKKFVAVPLVGLYAAASQAAITTTGITDAITDAGTAAGVVGLAVVVMLVGIKVYKWIRRAM